MHKISHFLLLSALLLVGGCAQIVNPAGGPRDTEPPVLDTLRSTPNFQTNFTKQELEFWFDEFVQLKDVFNQVVTSPPLRYDPPEIFIRNKSVRVRFDEREELKKNATYVINFGEAVRDISENNPTELRFVFSTGAFIDSLSVGGKVADAFTGEAAEEVLVMLYDNLADTVVRTERPFYFTKTDETGRFKIENVRADTFKVFALRDSNLDYLYNSEAEAVGFSDSLVIVTADRQPRNLTLSLSQAAPKAIFQEAIQDKYGLLRLAFSAPPTDMQLDYFDFGQKVRKEVKQDSLLVWYDDPSGGSWDIYLAEGTRQDTVGVQPFSKAQFLEKDTFFLENKKFGRQPLNPQKPAKLIFNHPPDSIAADRVILTKDTLKTPVVVTLSLDTNEVRTVNVNFKRQENQLYDLILLPGAVFDLYGLANEDTIRVGYKAASLKEFGNINLTVDSLDTTINYVFELLLEDQIIDTQKASDVTQFSHIYAALPPAAYRLRIIEDTDGNGKWSPADYDAGIQAERVFEKKLEALRANWEVDAVITVE